MSANKSLARVGAAAFALGLAAGPQTVGTAAADTPDADSTTVSAVQSPSRGPGASRAARVAKTTAAPAAAAPRVARAQAPSAAATPGRASATASVPSNSRAGAAEVPPSVVAILTGSAPSAAATAAASATPPLDPKSTIATPLGQLGQWMINKSGQIADWVGNPQPVSNTTGAGKPCPCTDKTILEGVNIIVVDTASSDPTQAKRNLNAWMRQAGFGASAISSTGYQGVLGAKTYGQQPGGPSQAFRNAYFFLANSHGRVFGPYWDAGQQAYVWTASLSKENLDLKNFSHGYDSFQTARENLVNGMVSVGAQNLGTVFMDNVYNSGEFSTGDANGYATVLGIDTVLKTATSPRWGYISANSSKPKG